MRRRVALCVGLMAGLTWGGTAAAVPPTEPPLPAEAVPTTVPPPATTPNGLPVALGPLIVVPPGCVAPVPARAVFRGTTVLVDDPARPTTYRFRVDAMLAGSLDGFEVANQVDVRFGDEARFLEIGQQYIAGVAIDSDTGLLVSAVREPAPLFGGDAVIGANDSDIDCPRVEDPVRTLMADGAGVEAGVLSPLKGEGSSLAAAILTPLAIAFGSLVALVLLKHLLFGIGRSLREMGTVPEASGRAPRQHRPSSTAGDQTDP